MPLEKIKAIARSAAYDTHRLFKDRDMPVHAFGSKVLRGNVKPKKAIPVTREELQNVLAALELVGGNSWQDLERTRENVGALLNTLLRRNQKEFT